MSSESKYVKQHLSIVIVGTVDAGKSSLTGRLLVDLGGVSDRKMKKLEEEAENLGKGSFKYAFVTDTTDQEKSRGLTIGCQTRDFHTDKYHYSIIDAPGHSDFIKNMISGAAQADSSLILIPADGNFEASIAKGDKKKGIAVGQSRHHAMLLNLLGIKQITVGVNKMDCDLAQYGEKRFNEIKDEVKDMLVRVGYPKKFVDNSVPIIPMSGFNGENILTKSDKMPWWKGQDLVFRDGRKMHVDTLLNCLNDMTIPPKRDPTGPVRVPISGKLNIKGVGDIVTGRIEKGTVKKDQEVVFIPTHTKSNPCSGKVFSIEMHHKRYEVGRCGDNVGINIKGLDKNNMPKIGDVMILKTDDSLKECKNFTTTLQLLEVPNEIKVGYTPVVFCKTNRAACTLTKINWKSGKETGGTKLENPNSLKSYETAEVVFEPKSTTPFVVEPFKNQDNESDEENALGRVAILEGHSLLAMGRISSYIPK